MIWTRKSLTETSAWFNKKALTPLDESLRIPIALEEIFRLAKEEYSIVLKKKPLIVHNGYFYFRSYWNYLVQLLIQPKAYLILWRLLRETKKAKVDWEKSVERFLGEFNQAKHKDLSNLNNAALFEHIQEIIKFDASWIFKLGAGLHTVYHYLSEILLHLLYPLLVKDKNPQNYQELLIGYPNKLKEADLAFWEVVKGNLSLDNYLEKYGFRATDVSLIIPTIGEDREELQMRVNAFRNVPIPDSREIKEELLEKRRLREEHVLKNFRPWIPFGRKLFNVVLKIAREYAPIRETRRFYYTKGSYLIRKSILLLGRRFEFLESSEDIFFLTKDELEKVVYKPQAVNKEKIRADIIKRRKQWQEWSRQAPPEQIKL